MANKGFTDRLRSILRGSPLTVEEIRREWDGVEPSSITALLNRAKDIHSIGKRMNKVYYYEGDEEIAKSIAEDDSSDESDEHTPEALLREIDVDLTEAEAEYVKRRSKEIAEVLKSSMKRLRMKSLDEVTKGGLKIGLKELGYPRFGGKDYQRATKYANNYYTKFPKFVPRIVEELDLSDEVLHSAVELTKKIARYPFSGSQTAVAGAIVYIVAEDHGIDFSYNEIAEKVSVSSPTISKRVKGVKKMLQNL